MIFKKQEQISISTKDLSIHNPSGKTRHTRELPISTLALLVFSSSVVCWHYVVCFPVLESAMNMVQNMTGRLSDSIHPSRVLINLVLFREAISFVLFNFVPCLGIGAMLIFNRLKLIIICNINFCYHCFLWKSFFQGPYICN